MLHFLNTYMHGVSHASTKTTYYNRLNTEADMRIQLCPIKPNIK